ncbi:serine/threonine protein kinase, putative [Plasmodium knowlesi strain H]|uniref:Serine/threonine protein kinase, putative n=3 Tax=Plasmodium knowlesi TaxID=5850 RepID=A0A5K1VK41_PLAKH|nr:serine/threonine protein kinase, putative [Plasmodium knowlesi strain H]OTN65539.1 putative Ser/Thr protein kinase [Plasmodium knowlesi]CAA9989720.1 serine/threonine protein kinase, putative [Plasmodium knowlesi strain H]SBO22874.1 serine/threonine protein kinase, putative [Plasmodium knowlesi strain H]SBO23027.1 serine/threonine protein kinase, putative [Plasmodium knowlesi strain H]VVS79194.1 serine/threonine protein kinase, putative [Plasmodium knowlesi strain H]|eukprot:XP_002260443.1 Ser/Thr protein kinase, putative [Plasmodium knowlesi strain H]
MLNKEDYLISLFDIVEGFNNYCALYKKKHCSSFIFSSKVLTKNERSKDTQDFKKAFSSFLSNIEFLHFHIVQKGGPYENVQSACIERDDCKSEELQGEMSHKEKNARCGEQAKNIFPPNEYPQNGTHSSNEVKQHDGGESKVDEMAEAANVQGTEKTNEENHRKSSGQTDCFYLNDIERKGRNENYSFGAHLSQSDFSDTVDSQNSTDLYDENRDLILSQRNEMLIRYVAGLDYALNVRRVSKEMLIDEIKKFFKVHNRNVRLGEYSSFLNEETMIMLRRRVQNDDDNMDDYGVHDYDDGDYLNVERNYRRKYKKTTFFFSIPGNYFFIKNYDDQSRDTFPPNNYANHDRSLNDITLYTLSNNSSNINRNNCNLYTDNVLSRNSSYNKFSSPTFGMEIERHMSPNFGTMEEESKSANAACNQFDSSSYAPNEETDNACLTPSLNSSPKYENDIKLNNSERYIPEKDNHVNDSSPHSSGSYRNHEPIGKSATNKWEKNHMYEIDSVQKKKNNLHSNTTDFYQSISDFYKSKENGNNSCEEGSNTCMKNSCLFLNSNETSVQTKNESYQENEENIINLFFDDELSSALTINNESSLSKGVHNCNRQLFHDKDSPDVDGGIFQHSNKDVTSENNHPVRVEQAVKYERDERKWMDEYCEGDYNMFRSEQIRKKKELTHGLSNGIFRKEETEKGSQEEEQKNVNTDRVTICHKAPHVGSNHHSDLTSVEQNSCDNMYNGINLRIIYERNKGELNSKGEIHFFPGQLILNKYKVVKILSKTKFSTTVKCLNVLYRKGEGGGGIHRGDNWKKNYPRECSREQTSDSLVISRSTILEDSTGKRIPCRKLQERQEIFSSNGEPLLGAQNANHKMCKYVCLKVMKNGKSFLDQGLFELIVLNMLSNESSDSQKNGDGNIYTNENIIQLYDYFYFKEHLIIVTEYMQSDLYNYFIKKGKIGTLGQLQILAKNLLQGLAFIHSKNLIHCDLKPENIMINMKRRKKKVKAVGKGGLLGKGSDSGLVTLGSTHCSNSSMRDNVFVKEKDKFSFEASLKDKPSSSGSGSGSTEAVDKAHIFSNEKFEKIKIIDFNSSIYESDKLEMYVQTRSYRSPEVLLQENYDKKIDIWSLGCILFEFLTKKILFDHQNIYRFIYSIASYIGPFPFYMIKGCRIPYLFTKHGLIILKKISVDKGYSNSIKEEPLDEVDDESVMFNSKDFFRLNKKENNTNDLLKDAHANQGSQYSSKLSKEIYYDVCYPSDNLLKRNFQIEDTLFLDFLLSLLQIDPCKRPNANEALKHPWLKPNTYHDGL